MFLFLKPNCRYCMRQVRAGRIVMTVDSTDLLNRRHLSDKMKDGKWLTQYPCKNERELEWGDIIVYSRGDDVGERVEESFVESVGESVQESLTVSESVGEGVGGSGMVGGSMKESVGGSVGDSVSAIHSNITATSTATSSSTAATDTAADTTTNADTPAINSHHSNINKTTILIVTYGNGVPTTLSAVDQFYENTKASLSFFSSEINPVTATTSNTTSFSPLTSTSPSTPPSTSSSSSLLRSSSLPPSLPTSTPATTSISSPSTAPIYSSKNNTKENKTKETITVVDCPCLSELPTQLEHLILSSNNLHSIIFADVCKFNSGMPLGMFAMKLQNQGMFFPMRNVHWIAIGGTNTYNPLGNTLTFLNSNDVIEAINTVIDRKNIKP